jgi:hypothetical protein
MMQSAGLGVATVAVLPARARRATARIEPSVVLPGGPGALRVASARAGAARLPSIPGSRIERTEAFSMVRAERVADGAASRLA